MRPGRRAVILLWMLGLLAGGFVILTTSFSTDMSAFLPRSPRAAQQILVDQLRDGVVSRLILVGIEGADPDRLADLSKAVAGELRQDPAFGFVGNGDEAAFARDREYLWRNRYLLSPAVTPEHFSVDALHQALQEDIRILGTELGMLIKSTLPADPTGEMLRIIGQIGSQSHPTLHDGVWLSADSTRALLMIQTSAPSFDIDAQERAIRQIDAAFVAAQRRFPTAAAARLVATGPPVFAVQIRTRMKADVERLSVIATTLVTLTLLFAYRSPRMLLLALLPVFSGVVAGIASVGLAFGFVHGITLGFGVTLIGEAVDYAIYLFTQTAPGGALAATLPRIWPTLRLGMLTSVCGFGAMLLSGFTGFAQLGLFTIVGLITALAVTRWVLPALMPTRLSAPGATAFALPVLALTRAGRLPGLVALALTVLAAGSLAMHAGPYWDSELESLSPISAEDKAQDLQLRREIGAADTRYLVAIRANTRDRAIEASEQLGEQLGKLIKQGAFTGFESPARWLPSQEMQRARQAALPDETTLGANLASAIEDTPFRPDGFSAFRADIQSARLRPLLTREDLNGTSLGLRLDSLLTPSQGGWLAMLPLQGVRDGATLAGAIAGLAKPGLILLDLKAESDRLLDDYLREALTLSAAGGLVIVLLLSLSLRSPRRIAAVLLPLAGAVICTAAVLLGATGSLSIFNLFGLLLVAAIGSNYCLFFERDFSAADAPTRLRLVASLVLADVCTVMGFGVLSFSAMPVLHGIGLTVAIGAGLSLLFAAMFSPRELDIATLSP
jgi:predicted exporter